MSLVARPFASLFLRSFVLLVPVAACSGKGGESGASGDTQPTDGGGDGGGDDGGGDGGTDTALDGVIGPAGGALEADGGARVDVPAGALGSDVALAIEQGVAPGDVGAANLPAEFTPVATVVLTPHGTAFSVPATLSLPYSSADLGAAESELVLLRLDDLSDVEWAPYRYIEKGSDHAKTEIDGFSVYSLASVAAGACPCWSGADLQGWMEAADAGGLTPRYFGLGVGSASVGGSSVGGFGNCTISDGGTSAAVLSTSYAEWSSTSGSGASYSCTRSGNSSYGGASPATTESLTKSQHAVCAALVASGCYFDRAALQLGVFATGLPTGESMSVTVATTSSAGTTSSTELTLSVADDLVWLGAVLGSGTTYTVTIGTQPSSATCAVVDATGTLDKDNVAVEIACTPTGTTVECPCADFTEADVKAAYDAAILLDNQEIGCFMGATQTSFGEPATNNEVSALEVRGETGTTKVSRLWMLGNFDSVLVCRAMDGETTITSEQGGMTAEEFAACRDEILAGMAYAGVDPATCTN